MMTFQELAEISASVIVSLGGGGAIVFGLSGYLGRIWADRALEKLRQENAQLNLQLTNQLTLITEERKHLLQLRQTEHQIRFSKLHEKRAMVVAKLYGRFVLAYWAAHTYHQWAEPAGGPSDEEQADSALKALTAAYRTFEKNRIYLSGTLSDELDIFFMRAKTLTMKARSFAAIPNKTEKTEVLHSEARRQGLEAFASEFPAIRHRLDIEFQKLLEPAVPTA